MNSPLKAVLAVLALATPVLAAPALVTAALVTPALAAPDPTPVAGAYALPDGQAKVSASLVVSPGAKAVPGTFVLDVAMTKLGGGRPVTRYEVELSKRLHLIAVSDDGRVFLHEHGEAPRPDGHFRIPMTFPHGGGWHVYADAVPAGLGQQVMRFDVDLGGAGAARPAAPQPAPAQPAGLEASDGTYGVRFDALDLRAGQEAALTLHLLHDGKAAQDVTPYLGVAAHAVFIAASDLTYVHAHAAPAAPTGHAMAGMHDMAGMAALRPGAKVPPDLVLHVRAPKPGSYNLWLQFMAGGKVRTVPFVVRVG